MTDDFNKLNLLTAHEFFVERPTYEHVDIIDWKVKPVVLSLNETFNELASLNLSQLELLDEDIIPLFNNKSFPNLRWLSLLANPVGITGIEAICEAVRDGRMPQLKILDTLGTDCDIAPYVDGYRWRMTWPAKELAEEYGYQQWMMLGSRDPDKENCEYLTEEQREEPYDRFNLT